MQMQISYDFTNLSQALEIAKKTAPLADIIEVGSQLIIAEGINAIKEFKSTFPNKPIFADVKIVDRVSEIIPFLAKAETKYISVLYGTSNKVIKKASATAHSVNAKIVLDLIDPDTMGQGALDAESLNVDHILFHYPHETGETSSHIEEWETVRGNTKLPIFIAGRVNRTNIDMILKLKPQGIVIGEAITKADNPEAEARYFRNLIVP
jgi:3-keto-L-gulonate-6-phosphate decarboxylase